MTTVLPGERLGAAELNQTKAANERIGQQVLRTLGKPPDLIRVQVRTLWGKYYRVNVFVGPDAACATIGYSYFVAADVDGRILESTPKITKGY